MTPFGQTLESLRRDEYVITSLGGLLGLGALFGWAAWFFCGSVRLIEVTEAARLQTDGVAFALQSPVSGLVTDAHLALDQAVQTGELLVRLDASAERLERAQVLAQLEGIDPQLEHLQGELLAQERADRSFASATQAAQVEALTKLNEVEVLAQTSQQAAQRYSQLTQEGLYSELDLLKASRDALLNAAQVQTTSKLAARLDWEGKTQYDERHAALHRMQRDAARLESDRSVLAATLRRLDNEIGRREIRSPAAGRLGEVLAIRPGAVVREGEKLGSVVAAGPPLVVADFLAPGAIGRVRHGQRGQMRLAGFPWAEFGVLEAVVKNVGSESVDGRVRVELDLSGGIPTRIPIRHGMTGSVEVELERIAPVELVLRSLGKYWAAEERGTP